VVGSDEDVFWSVSEMMLRASTPQNDDDDDTADPVKDQLSNHLSVRAPFLTGKRFTQDALPYGLHHTAVPLAATYHCIWCE